MVSIDTLTLLDPDPDDRTPAIEGTESGEDNIDYARGILRLEDSESGYDSDESDDFNQDAKFWEDLNSDKDPSSHCDQSQASDTSLHGYDIEVEPTSQGIKFSSIGTYRNLFSWDFERYSFPSGHLRVQRTNCKTGQAVKEDKGARAEIERLKREVRAELAGAEEKEDLRQSPKAGHPVHHLPSSPKPRPKPKPKPEPQSVVEEDLLGEVRAPPLTLLDLDSEMDAGYSWKGPVRDIETGRPLTPYRDDTTSSSSSSSRHGSRAPGGDRRRGGQLHGRFGLAVALPPQEITHKPSTRSLPSSGRGRDSERGRGRGGSARVTVHHQPSLPIMPSNPNNGQDTHRRPKTLASPYTRLLSKPQARRILPDHISISSSPLQHSIILSWKNTCAEKSYQKSVLRLLERLTRSINLVFDKGNRSGPGRFEVDVFGSVSWGGETGTSGDLDMVVIDHQQPQGYMPDLWRVWPGETPPAGKGSQRSQRVIPGLPGVYDLYKLAGMLRNMGMDGVTAIRGANTPIVKFKVGNFDSQSNSLECDINVNDLGGWHNSSLILAYCELSPYVLRPLIHALKLWSSAQGLNDPSGAKGLATMSSYCLTLMAIAYLQVRGHLPNLQANVAVRCPSYPTDRDDPDLVWVGWGKPQGTHAHVAFSRTPPKNWKSTDSSPDLNADQALRGFFAYFGTNGEVIGTRIVRRFDRGRDIVSVLNGGIMDRAEAMDEPETILSKEEKLDQEAFMGKGDRGVQPAKWKEKQLVVQDPFIWQKNCTTSMHVKGLEKWFQAVDRTDHILRNKGDKATLADILVPLELDVNTESRRGSKPKRGPKGKGAGDAVERFAQRVQGARGRGRGRDSAPSMTTRPDRGGPPVGQLLEM